MIAAAATSNDGDTPASQLSRPRSTACPIHRGLPPSLALHVLWHAAVDGFRRRPPYYVAAALLARARLGRPPSARGFRRCVWSGEVPLRPTVCVQAPRTPRGANNWGSQEENKKNVNKEGDFTSQTYISSIIMYKDNIVILYALPATQVQCLLDKIIRKSISRELA